ncbi:39S mitochondrial ribosomal protein L46-domain-containing protein [Echria macrotheca]|uniref:Large ribosomal subunit protein mL46 n=1 Tax=Echria macrotheca TaxID=438768 RepID=A0AAJ0BG49_9PEZI|nr:39S mitochondrial ribosomal protein L46-domain-containing protein [Echria macrotheca]
MAAAASRGGGNVVAAALMRNSRRAVCVQCFSSSRSSSAAVASAASSGSRFIAQQQQHRRYFADTATTTTTTSTPPIEPATTSSPIPDQKQQQYTIKSSLILTRAPLLTRTPTPFESSFYLYQKRLDERLAVPFRRQFYFRKDTAAELDWRLKIGERHGVAAKDIGRYNPRGRRGWNDEVLTGSLASEPGTVVEKLLRDAEMRVSEDGEEISAEERVAVEKPGPRRTGADEVGDVRRLDRELERTLYLVVKRGEGDGDKGWWGFPEGVVRGDEVLHETAARVLAESAGVNMNTWIVGRVPVAHHVKKVGEGEGEGEKIFFLKGRIMAGQADLAGNVHGLTDFKWLTKEELKEVLPVEYYRSVKGMFDLR